MAADGLREEEADHSLDADSYWLVPVGPCTLSRLKFPDSFPGHGSSGFTLQGESVTSFTSKKRCRSLAQQWRAAVNSMQMTHWLPIYRQVQSRCH
jgi:hypothetical protein